MRAGTLVDKVIPVLNGLGDEIREVAEDYAVGLIDPSKVLRRFYPTVQSTAEALLLSAMTDLGRAREATARRFALTRVCGLSYLLLAIDEVERGGDLIEEEMKPFHREKRCL